MIRLREQTSDLHERAEGRPLEQALFRGTLPREQFVAYLGQRFFIHRLLEARIGRLCTTDARLGDLIPAELLQEPNLRADLAFFGVSVAGLRPRAATLRLMEAIEHTSTREPIALLGYNYVFEGSKNGAHFMAARLRQAYGLETDGLRYIDPHGDRQRPLWREFKERMDAIAFTPAEADRIVAAARLTFAAVADIDDELYEGSTSGAAPAAASA